MAGIKKKNCRNLLLRRMSDAGFEALSSHLESVSFSRGDILIEADTEIEKVFFVETGLLSLVLKATDERSAEIGIVGMDGVVGAMNIAGVMSLPYVCFVQVPGSAFAVPEARFREVCEKHPDMAMAMVQYGHILGLQAAQTALANARYSVDERLARWLLMCQDRIGGNEIELTHDFLSTILSVRRSTVTLSTHLLEGQGVIRAQRGRITILRRKELVGLAQGSYGMPEAEYERIFGVVPN